MLPPYLPASRKTDRATPIRTASSAPKARAGNAGTRVGLKSPLRVIGRKADASVTTMRKIGLRLC
jgi:hypothetical protein